MDLTAGTRLGPYAILRPIGAGAMGVVYRAEDPRLGRLVAIKVLPQMLRDHPDHLRRFEQEARAIGGLNHPNLLTLHDIGDHDGSPYFVTEHLDGESLRERLESDKPTNREAVRIAVEVAHGLAAAHDAGIVHRDIKPENLFVTDSGRVKILDFGIAKLLGAAASDVRLSIGSIATQPTAAGSLATGIGEMVGTPGYMAPEQLGGAAVDARTDIFALGVVLYEMLTGTRPFASGGLIEEAYAILKLDPEPIAGVPTSLMRVITRCLEKRPEARFQSAADLAFALEALDVTTEPVSKISAPDLRETVTSIDVPLAERRAPGARGVKPFAVVVVTMLAIIVGLLAGRLAFTRKDPRQWPTLVEGGPRYHRVTFHSQPRWNGRFAPDGQGVFYSIDLSGRTQVVRSDLGQPSMVAVGVDGRLLDVSQKGELLVVDEPAAYDGGALSRAFPASGSRPIADHVVEAAWAPDGETIAVNRTAESGPRIEYPLGTTVLQRPSGSLRMLRLSPDGELLAFRENPSSEDTRGRVVITDRRGKPIASSVEYADVEGIAWARSGREVWFSTGSTIRALSLDGKERELVHGAARLELFDIGAGDRMLVASDDIRLKMFVKHKNGPATNASWFDGTNVESVSADGHVIAFAEGLGTGQSEAGYAVFTRTDMKAPAMLGHSFHVVLAPDAQSAITITGATTPLNRISTKAETHEPIAMGRIAQFDISDRISISWSGKEVVIRAAEAGKPMQLWLVPLDGGEPKPLGRDAPHEKHPISPDGTVVALTNAMGGVTLVAVGGGADREIAGPRHEQPIAFSGDGSALYTYFEKDGEIAIDEIKLASGERSTWDTLHPEQLGDYFGIALDAAGTMSVYTVLSSFADLYVVQPD